MSQLSTVRSRYEAMATMPLSVSVRPSQLAGFCLDQRMALACALGYASPSTSDAAIIAWASLVAYWFIVSMVFVLSGTLVGFGADSISRQSVGTAGLRDWLLL